MKRLLIVLAALWFAGPAEAQVRQSGNVTPTHVACFTSSGVIQDCGASTSPYPTTFGVLNGTGLDGICVQSDKAPSAGWQRVCLGATTAAGGILSVQNFGTAPTGGFVFEVNGAVSPIPVISGPVVAGDGACFSSTSGTIVDCGLSPLTRVLANGQIFVGNASNVATGVTPSGVVSVTNVGVFSFAPFVQNTIVPVAGLACDGVTDDSSVFQTAINALTAPATAALPRGTCVLHGITIPTGVSIKGASQDGTVVIGTGNGQTIFSHAYSVVTFASFGITDLTINCGSFASVTAISVTKANRTRWRNLDVLGCATSIVIDQGTDHEITNFTAGGNAAQGAGQIKIWSSDDTQYVFSATLSNINTINVGTGVQATAVYFRRAINSYLSNYGANGLTLGGSPQIGILIENDCQGVFVTNAILAAPSTGIVLQTGTGVSVAPSFNYFTNFGVDQASTTGVSIASGTYNIFNTGNVVAGGVAPSTNGITISGGAFNTIQAVTVEGYNGATGAAVNFTTGAADYTLANNRWDTNHFCLVMAGTSTDLRLIGNTCTNVTTGVSGTYAAAGVMASNNLGLGFVANVPSVYQDAGHGLVIETGNGAVYDGAIFNRGGSELFANPTSSHDIRLVGDPGTAANQGHLLTGSFPPSSGTPTGCGTGSPTVVGSDTAGLITTGTNAGGCTIVFTVAYVSAPFCVVTWQTNVASMQYTISSTQIVIVQTSTTGAKINYMCMGQTGG